MGPLNEATRIQHYQLNVYATYAKLPAEKFMLSNSNLTDTVISDFPPSSI